MHAGICYYKESQINEMCFLKIKIMVSSLLILCEFGLLRFLK